MLGLDHLALLSVARGAHVLTFETGSRRQLLGRRKSNGLHLAHEPKGPKGPRAHRHEYPPAYHGPGICSSHDNGDTSAPWAIAHQNSPS